MDDGSGVSFSFHDSHGSEFWKASVKKSKLCAPGGVVTHVSIPAFAARPCRVCAACTPS